MSIIRSSYENLTHGGWSAVYKIRTFGAYDAACRDTLDIVL